MAEAFLQILLENLTSFIQEEVGLFFGFENEFNKLLSTFSTIQDVLDDAQEKQLKDEPLENWLEKLNVAAYEADDILDECKTEAARLKQTKYGIYHPKAIAFRYKIGKRMKEMMEKLDAIAKERTDFHLHEKIIERQVARPETGSVLTEPQVYGRDKEEDEIVKILINNVSNAQELSVLPILGMGGLGKTTLAQMVFNDQRPPRIGSLTCLKTLGQFIVKRKKGYQLGEISITRLERVKNDKEAKEANLSAKENLHSLSMKWDDDEHPHRYESEEVEVLEALKPHSNLTCLTISGFRGIRLPDWMNHSVLKNVVLIEISGCKNCSCLPPFGDLPCLESLELYRGSADLII